MIEITPLDVTKKSLDREITLTRRSRLEEAIFLIDRDGTAERKIGAGR